MPSLAGPDPAPVADCDEHLFGGWYHQAALCVGVSHSAAAPPCTFRGSADDCAGPGADAAVHEQEALWLAEHGLRRAVGQRERTRAYHRLEEVRLHQGLPLHHRA